MNGKYDALFARAPLADDRLVPTELVVATRGLGTVETDDAGEVPKDRGLTDETLLPQLLIDTDPDDDDALAPDDALPSTVALEFSTGERMLLVEPAVIGREPQSPSGARSITTRSDLVDLSRTHLGVVPTDTGALVRDLGSANGTVVERAGVRAPLAPLTPTHVVPGDVIVLAGVLAIRIGAEE